tara:strand:+ start:133 stop:762 length:630 start_codon:yes stop_codon:yes gene_type:complete
MGGFGGVERVTGFAAGACFVCAGWFGFFFRSDSFSERFAALAAASLYPPSSRAATPHALAASSCCPSWVYASPILARAFAHVGSMRTARCASARAPLGLFPSAKIAAARLENAFASLGASATARLYAAIACLSSPVANASLPLARASPDSSTSCSIDPHPHREHCVRETSQSGCIFFLFRLFASSVSAGSPEPEPPEPSAAASTGGGDA